MKERSKFNSFIANREGLVGDSGKTDRSFRSSGTLNPLETEQYFFS